MVVIHMKSTIDKDEYLVKVPAATPTDDLYAELVALHNLRVRIKSQSSALYYLLHEKEYDHCAAKSDDDKNRLQELHDRIRHALHADRVAERAFASRVELQELADLAEGLARELFDECKGDDAVDKLWKAREDGETKEDDRLRAWYFLELVDRQFKERDFYAAEKVKLWWAGKEVAKGKVLRDYSGPNEKSKMVCKLAAEAKGCPAREPKLDSARQQELRRHFEEKRSTFQQLEDSELAEHRNVRRKPSDFVAFRAPTSTGKQLFGDGARGTVDGHAAAGGEGLLKLNTDVRKIHHPTTSSEP